MNVAKFMVQALQAWNPRGPEAIMRRATNKAFRKARRKAKRGETITEDEREILSTGQAEPVEAAWVSMNSTIATQIVLAILRHAMTALAPLGVVVTDDWMVQTAALIVGLIGLAWSFKRKLKPSA